VEEAAVIGEEEDSAAVLVQAADAGEGGIPLEEAWREEIVDEGAGVLGAAGVAEGFVEHEDQRKIRVQRFAVVADGVVGRRAVGVERGAIGGGEGTRAEQVLDFPARAVAEAGQMLDQFHGGDSG
jgi:hypothetical protein